MSPATGPKHKLTPPRSYASKVADILRREIEQSVFRPGERLPTEAVLGQTFGVSRAVIREAIFALKQEGIVKSYQGRGIFVVDELPEASFSLARTELDDKEEIERVFEFLLAHEASAAELAAQRRTQTDLENIGAALEAIDGAIERGENGIEQDMAFHSEILKATKNHLFISFGAFLENRVRHLIRQARTNSKRKGLTALVQGEHRAIFDAIAAGDSGMARRAAETHLKNAAQRLTLYMEEA
ncbi:FadR/GntR family transcriptional regulator [Pseudodonghicola flavimaris]|uniref:FadR/GntR family transcriptional regulator n=1 Tax=Pseudodonghicola flavimaris TaxID=3050036 RepID=A0ABT7F8B4_9RHOB|nr:FadR/GntR family transcriptional regulator [Pseudodonghicola flavimaris]MDK3020851.1 FadR/GntR family transcriptional regulator [Pseudodonghicola flavimaris]